MLLPYIEQSGLYEALEVTTGIDFPAPANTLTQTPLSAYHCPSAADRLINSSRENFGKSNYNPVMGTVSANGMPTATVPNGVFGANSTTRFADIADGTSNVIAFGEKYQGRRTEQSPNYLGGTWAGLTTSLGWGAVAGILNSTPDRRINGLSEHSFASPHPGGMMFLFCDGTVRLIREEVDGQALEILVKKSSGLTVPSSAL
jgi:prepilin-type processing-associated H-X9-DG protein